MKSRRVKYSTTWTYHCTRLFVGIPEETIADDTGKTWRIILKKMLKK
jgi:hypothetical protein